MSNSPYIIAEAHSAIMRGDVIIYPTDTLYALGADATNPIAIEKIFSIKKRDGRKALSIAVGAIKDIETYAVMTPLAYRLAEKFLPGPLTLVLEKKDTLAPNLTSDNTVGVRVIDHPLFKDLSVPLTATSANISGKETPQTTSDILSEIGSKHIACVIDEGVRTGRPSTIVDARGTTPIILREGSIRNEELL